MMYCSELNKSVALELDMYASDVRVYGCLLLVVSLLVVELCEKLYVWFFNALQDLLEAGRDDCQTPRRWLYIAYFQLESSDISTTQNGYLYLEPKTTGALTTTIHYSFSPNLSTVELPIHHSKHSKQTIIKQQTGFPTTYSYCVSHNFPSSTDAGPLHSKWHESRKGKPLCV